MALLINNESLGPNVWTGQGKCRRCYYSFWVHPAGREKAVVNTCRWHTAHKENNAVVSGGLARVWNDRRFRKQREAVKKLDWGFCRGASCVDRDYMDVFAEDKDVCRALEQRETRLRYLPKTVHIAPSFLCNQKCRFCPQRIKNRDYSLSASLIRELKEEIIPAAAVVAISGGEPFYSEEGRGLIDWICGKYPEKKLQIITNGTLLHEFGREKIIEKRIFIRISLYGMTPEVYRRATGTDNFTVLRENIDFMLAKNYERMEFLYLVTGETEADAEKFCGFISANPGISGIIQNNRFEGQRCWETMKRLEVKYKNITKGLKFEYRDERQ